MNRFRFFQVASTEAGAPTQPAEPVEEKKPEAHTNAVERRGFSVDIIGNYLIHFAIFSTCLISMNFALLFWFLGQRWTESTEISEGAREQVIESNRLRVCNSSSC